MIKLLNYELNSDYESNKDSLNQLDNYVALTEDNQTIHLKPLNIFYITTNNSGTTIYKRTDNANGKETVTLENGENKLTDWNYGFNFDFFSVKQDQITSFDLSKYDTSNVTNMNSMFSDCSGLTSLNLSNFNTSNVTNMNLMFSYCRGLTSLDISNFDTSKVTSMDSMFEYCSGLTSLNLSNFDTYNVFVMSRMFYKCSGLTSLDLSNFNTSNLTNMSNMFNDCTNLTSLDLSNFDISNINISGPTFQRCFKLTHIKCTQAFKDWCINNKDIIVLPEAMVNGTVGNDSSYNWEIINLQG